MVKEITYCCYRLRPTNKLTECGAVSYGQCAAEHPIDSYFCFAHLEQCRTCGEMFCPAHKVHECTEMLKDEGISVP